MIYFIGAFLLFAPVVVGGLLLLLRSRPMSAECAADVAESARQELDEKRRNDEFAAVIKNISKRALEGSNVCTYWETMYPSTIERLQKLGYTVSGQSISWGKKS